MKRNTTIVALALFYGLGCLGCVARTDDRRRPKQDYAIQTAKPTRDGKPVPPRRFANVLRIVCDIPDRVGSVPSTHPGRIDWSGGSEEFAFKLSEQSFDVLLEHPIPTGSTFRVFFNIAKKPVGATKFIASEWHHRARVGRGNLAGNAVVVRLSQFRDADWWASMRMGPP